MIGLEYIVDIFQLKYKDVAQSIGVSPKSLNDWVKGRSKIPEKRLKQLSELFNGLKPEFFTEELTEVQQLEIQIEYYEGNSEFAEEEVGWAEDNGETFVTKEVYRQNKEVLTLLYDELEIAKATEGSISDLKGLIKNLYYESEDIGEFYSKAEKIGYYMKLVNYLVSILKGRKSAKTEAIERILYYFTILYGQEQRKWENINPLIPSSKHGDFYIELDNLLKKYNFN